MISSSGNAVTRSQTVDVVLEQQEGTSRLALAVNDCRPQHVDVVVADGQTRRLICCIGGGELRTVDFNQERNIDRVEDAPLPTVTEALHTGSGNIEGETLAILVA